MAVKTVVTNYEALRQKYGENARAIIAALPPLQASDRSHNIVTTVVDMSDKVQMARLNAPVVTSAADGEQNKKAVDAVYAGTNPHYLMILGGSDIVPFQSLENPVQENPVRDPDVPSDLPYASDAPYGREPSRFLTATRVVGRLPDVTGPAGAADPSYLPRLIDWLITLRQAPRSAYQSYFSVSAKVWLQSTQETLKAIFSDAGQLHSSPPEGPSWSQDALSARSVFVNCHGSSQVPTWYGDNGQKVLPPAVTAGGISGRITQGTIVGAECCYGAQLYAPPAPGALGICSTYLESGAVAFVGSTNIAYGSSWGRTYADLLPAYWMTNMLAGRSAGAAMLEAQHEYMTATHGAPSPIDVKTMAQFVLLGDPSVVPVQPPPPSSVEVDPEYLIGERRRQATLRGRLLGMGLAVPVPDPELDFDPRVLELARERGIAAPQVRSYRSEWAGAPDLLAEPLPVMHVVWSESREDDREAAPILVVRELEGRIVAVEEVWER